MEYLLKASGIIALFYTIYFLFLRKETFFKINRFFLLSGLLLALVFPKIAIPIYIEYTPIEVSNLFIENTAAPSIASPKPIDTDLNFLDYALILYLVGVAFFLIRFIIQLFSLAIIIIKNKNERHGKYRHVITSGNISPFSFFNWMVYNPKQFNESELEQIITHEKVHVNQLHSIDVLVVQLMSIFLWFNPFIHLYSKNLKQNLEFLADNTALNSLNSKKAYQYILLKTSAKNHQLALSNNFYNSFIKKRIVMLQKSKSKKINLIKYLLVLPALGWFLMSFNTKAIYVESESAQTSSNDSISQFEIKSFFTEEDFIEFKRSLAVQGFNFELKSIQRGQNNLVSSIYFVVTKNGAECSYRSGGGMTSKTLVIQYFENKNKFIINTQEFINAQKDLESSEDIVQLRIDKNTNIRDIEAKKQFLKDKYNLDLEYEVIEKDANNNIKIYSIKLGKGKMFKRIKTSSDKPLVFNYNPKTNELVHYSINENGDPTYGNTYTLDSRKNYMILNHYNDKDLKILVKELNKNDIEVVFKDVKRNENDTIIGISITAESKTGNKLSYQQHTGHPITPIAISYYENGKLNGIGPAPAHYRSKNLKNNITIPKNALYVINDEISTKEAFEKLDYDTIKTISILEDEKATAAYGDKGKNGVVLISTKTNLQNDENPWKLSVGRKATNSINYSESLNTNNGLGTNNNKAHKIKIGHKLSNQDSLKNPLYILDGKEVNYNSVKSLLNNDVNTINVFKDAMAIAKYGDKGKNGVIEITSNKSKWKAEKSRNINIIYATKDTIYVHKKPDIIREFASDLKKTPLFIVDGKEISKKEFIAIDPFDVERISVIKPEQVNLDEYGEKGKNGVVRIKLRTENSNTPFIKVVGDAKFIVDGIAVSSEAFYKISPEQIKSVVATSSSNGESTIKVSTKKKK